MHAKLTKAMAVTPKTPASEGYRLIRTIEFWMPVSFVFQVYKILSQSIVIIINIVWSRYSASDKMSYEKSEI